MTTLRHTCLEEEFAFPPIRGDGLVMPIMVMEREHGMLWRQMDDLDDALDNFDDVTAIEQEREALIRTCQQMLAVLESHNSKEEPIVRPHLDVRLTTDQAKGLHRLIGSGSLPGGWECARAREG